MIPSRDSNHTNARSQARTDAHALAQMHAWHKTIIGPKPSNLSIQAQLFSEMMCKQLYCLGIGTDELFSFSDLNGSSVSLRRNTPTNFPSAKVNMTEKRADTVLPPTHLLLHLFQMLNLVLWNLLAFTTYIFYFLN